MAFDLITGRIKSNGAWSPQGAGAARARLLPEHAQCSFSKAPELHLCLPRAAYVEGRNKTCSCVPLLLRLHFEPLQTCSCCSCCEAAMCRGPA